jgi:hypothetical protein
MAVEIKKPRVRKPRLGARRSVECPHHPEHRLHEPHPKRDSQVEPIQEVDLDEAEDEFLRQEAYDDIVSSVLLEMQGY